MRNLNLTNDPAWYHLLKWWIPLFMGGGMSTITYMVITGRFIAQTMPILGWPSLVNTIPTITSLSGFLGGLAKVGFVLGSGAFAFGISVFLLHPIVGMVDMRMKNVLRALNANHFNPVEEDRNLAIVRKRYEQERADPFWYNFAKWILPFGTSLVTATMISLLLFAKTGVGTVPALGWIAALVMSLEGASSFVAITAMIGSFSIFAGYLVGCVTHTIAAYYDCKIKDMLREDFNRNILEVNQMPPNYVEPIMHYNPAFVPAYQAAAQGGAPYLGQMPFYNDPRQKMLPRV